MRVTCGVARSCGGVAIRYVLPVLWMTSCLQIMARNRRRTSDSIGSSMVLSLFIAVAYTQTDPLEGSTGPGAESDIYDCPVTTVAVVICVTCSGS